MTLGAQWSGDRRPETKLGGPSVQTPLWLLAAQRHPKHPIRSEQATPIACNDTATPRRPTSPKGPTGSPVPAPATNSQPRTRDERALRPIFPRLPRAVRFNEEEVGNNGASAPEYQRVDQSTKGPPKAKRRKASSYFGDIGLSKRDLGAQAYPRPNARPETARPETGAKMPKPSGDSGAAARPKAERVRNTARLTRANRDDEGTIGKCVESGYLPDKVSKILVSRLQGPDD
jgi:hypothetical protein